MEKKNVGKSPKTVQSTQEKPHKKDKISGKLATRNDPSQHPIFPTHSPTFLPHFPTTSPQVFFRARKVRYFHVTRNVKSNFFCAKTFNIFYIFGREKISTSAFRAPIKPRKFPQKHLENPQKHIEFPTSDVFLPLFWAKKEERTPCLGALSSSLVQR
ncbi:MAG: hypothetical protein MR505_01855 [Bacteroidales bacterium]|nr:hypothetical protein [Bacteroidales bacterium]